jgi:thiol:disulfide interchange protein
MLFTGKRQMAWWGLMSVLATSAAAWAASGEASVLLPRWPLIAAGLAVAALGLVAVRLQRGWYELAGVSRARRVMGLIAASLGLFWVMFGATEAPPVGQGAARLAWGTSYARAAEQAAREGKPLLVDFTASWCNACNELEAEVFEQPAVRAMLMRQFVLVKVDFDADTPESNALLARFGVSGLPSVVFVSPDGVHLKGVSFEGKLTQAEFEERAGRALRGEGAEADVGLAGTLKERGWWVVLGLVFVAGFLSSLTPCVYPLIPITIALFGAKGASSRREALLLSLTYVLGIAVTYSLMGIVAALAGGVFGGLMQSGWVLGAVSLLFVAMGLWSAGAFEVRLPGWLQEGLSQRGGAGYAGALVMGLVAGIIAAPCVGPVVGGILVYVAERQDVFRGWALLTAFASGLGVPFVVLGTFSSLIKRLPRSGGWMEGVKLVFAVCFWAIALYYARLFVPGISQASEALWMMLAGLTA